MSPDLDAHLAGPPGWLDAAASLEVVAALGIPVPPMVRLAAGARWEEDPLPGDRRVVKRLDPAVLHKTEAGAVRATPRAEVAATVAALGPAPAGHLVQAWVPHPEGWGGELLVGLRGLPDLGPVVIVGPGGTDAEALAAAMAPEGAIAVIAPGDDDDTVAERLARVAAVRAVVQPGRGRAPRADLAALTRVVRRLLDAAGRVPHPLAELEINPLAAADGALCALDARVRLGPPPPPPPRPRPLAQVRALLAPRRVAVVGVSERPNPGRRILGNLLRDGFPPEALTVVKPGTDAVAGVRAVPDLAALPAPVDLLVVATAAATVPALVDAAVTRAAAVLVIPGGLGERAGSEPLVARVRATLEAARAAGRPCPVVAGGNSLGVRSAPGRLDTLFLPDTTFPPAVGPPLPLALIAQSGAFAAVRAARLGPRGPRHLVSVGNQLDLTQADWLEALAEDDGVRVFGVYLEGLGPGDGRRWLDTAARLVAAGRRVVALRAARTAAGARAGASHTAAVAGDARVFRALAEAAGVWVADTVEGFDDLLRLALAWPAGPVGRRVAAVSNAGFECVAVGDTLGPLTLAPLAEGTRAALAALVTEAGLDGLVDPSLPLDLTPMADDATFDRAVGLLQGDPSVDVTVAGLVPLTAALRTVDAGLADPEGVAARLARRADGRPLVVVVDGGPRFAPLAAALTAAGLAVLPAMDRAMVALARATRPVSPSGPAAPSPAP